MGRNTTYNILMYCHDTYGLGHIRRTMAIAEHLRAKNINILILTGSPIVGRYPFPEQIDFVRIPGMIKKTNEDYFPMSIRINPQHALDIRKNIITSTAKAFQPQLFIVDKEPLGLKKEVLPTLQWLRRSLPRTKTVLGLRDIMDDGETIRQDWRKKGVYEILEELYSEIWVYGIREFYDPIREYAISEGIGSKMYFTGYIPRKKPDEKAVEEVRREHGVREEEKLVVVTTGGGGDGYPVIDMYLTMLESMAARLKPIPFRSILITGPFMPAREHKKISKRTKPLGIRIHRFYRSMEKLLAAADLVVGMGGYNTVCEILTQGTPCLLIPRESPRKEQLIRAGVLHERRLVDYIPLSSCSPDVLCREVFRILENPKRNQDAVNFFQMTGFEVMTERLESFRNNKV